ncbi:hypothetical protein [Phyllobacterium phragmitis]|nr:hypothetical protein [Phyllobacterium phragmitis]
MPAFDDRVCENTCVGELLPQIGTMQGDEIHLFDGPYYLDERLVS